MAPYKRERSSSDEDDCENSSTESDDSSNESHNSVFESSVTDIECSDDDVMRSQSDEAGGDSDKDSESIKQPDQSTTTELPSNSESAGQTSFVDRKCATLMEVEEPAQFKEKDLPEAKAEFKDISEETDSSHPSSNPVVPEAETSSELKTKLVNSDADVKPDFKPDVKEELKPDEKPEVKPETQPHANLPDVKQEANPCVNENTAPTNTSMSYPLVKSRKELKKDLKALLKLFSTNSGDYATGGLLPDVELPNIPQIEVTGFGILPFPIIETTFEAVKPFCKQSPYGLGEETLIDTSVRNSFQLDPSQFKIGNKKFVSQVNDLIQRKIRSALGLAGVTIYGKIYKLLIYEKGGKFDEHRDTEKEDNMFGTLIVQLPSVFQGGNLEVKHLNTSKVFENSSAGSSTHCRFVAHYASCPHQLKEVTSGYRAALIYSLCWEGNGMKPSPYTASTNVVRLCNTLNLLMESTKLPFLCWGLEYDYSDKSMSSDSSSCFKGKDKNVVAALKNAMDHDKNMSGKEKWEMVVGTANKRIEEYGDCNGGGSRWDRGCCGGCDWFEENERSFDINNFVPVIANSSVCNELKKFNIDPPKDIINFPKRKAVVPEQAKRRKRNDSDEEFWGTKDLGNGCSGPSGNEGSTRDRWYQKRVLLLWRSDRSLAFKCLSSMAGGVSHVLSLLEKGETLEGEEGFKYLWQYREEIPDDDSLIEVLKMCHILNRKEEALDVLKMLEKSGITSEDSGKVIAKTAILFPDDPIINGIKQIIKHTRVSNISTLLQFCRDFTSIEQSVIVQILVNDVLKGTSQHMHKYGYYSYNNDPTPLATTILKYMFEKNVLPDSLLDTLTSQISDLTNLVSAITLTVDNLNVKVLNLLVMRYTELASQIKKPVTNRYSYGNNSQNDHNAVAKIVKALVEAPKKHQAFAESVSTVINIIVSLPKNQQKPLIRPFVNEIIAQYSSNKSNLPECLQQTCQLQAEYLKETVSKGEPKLSWNQPNASVPGDPAVEAFFKGPSKSMVYGRNVFTSITQARRWASQHAKDPGCYKTLTPSGTGRNAVVNIVKTTEHYDKQVASYRTIFKENQNLLKFLPKQNSVLPVEKKQDSSGIINLDDKENQKNQANSNDQSSQQHPKTPARSLQQPQQSSQQSPQQNSLKTKQSSQTPIQLPPEKKINKSYIPVDVITID